MTGGIAPVLLRYLDPVFGRVRLPIRWLVDMNGMSRDRDLSRACATDPKGGGVRVPLGWLADFLTFEHTAPEGFDAAPVTLVHPAADSWTPAELSIRFLQRIPHRTALVMLENCGHFPIEEPGLTQLRTALREVLDAVTKAAS